MQGINLQAEIQNEIIAWAKKCKLHKVILFGSRARGDNRERSDIDLAVSGGNAAEFSVGIDEEIHTLLMFDVVNLDGAVQQELRQAIEKEGIVLYEEIGEF